ncbi:hypothetical protein AB0E82_01850 [Streptomyces anulatus]|uniref:hypothetical protein n=1 Tax=Streptomyces anulatus TaxID=1892 RepID=UPI0033C8222E
MSAPMTPDREQEIRTLDLPELMSDRVAPVISGHLAVLLAELVRLRARVAELEAAPSPATVLRQVADKWAAHCPDHSEAEDVWMDCPEDWVFELRRAADDRAEGGVL